jgi:spore coat polysaccharide biosynthesis predicted glycosyltransferase SpsG
LRITILTEGGSGIGLGHVARCLALAQGIEEYFSKYAKLKQPGNMVNIELVINGENLPKYMFKGQNFKIKVKDWVKEYKEIEGKLKMADLVIIDSYLAAKRIYDFVHKVLLSQGTQSSTHSSIKSFIHKLICIDDYNRISYPPCIVVNGSVNGEKLGYPISSAPDKHMYLLGREYVILRKEFWKVPKKNIRKKLRDILVVFGGDNHISFSSKVIECLIKFFPGITCHVVTASRNIDNRRLIPESSNLYVNQYRNLSPLGMRDLMLKCDVAISAGGQTLYELARVGIPTIGICFGRNQLNNLKGFHGEGFLEFVGRYNDNKVFNRIDRAVKSLIPQVARNKKSVIGRKLLDSKGIERILNNLSRTNI